METEKGPLKEIDEINSDIESKQEVLSLKHNAMEDLQARIEALRKEQMTSKERIGVMDLNLEAFNLSEEVKDLEVKIKIQEEKRSENQKKVQQIRSKSFFKKLLRQ